MLARLRRSALVLACAALAATGVTGAGCSSVVRYHAGAAGLGDPYFPQLGNGGYDVQHYTLDLGYTPSSRRLAGTVHLRARATQNLSRFDLDLSGMTVSSVAVNGSRARWTRPDQELRITPAHGLRSGRDFDVDVTYAGSPRTVTGSPIVFGAAYGWEYTPDGAFVGDEPNAAHTWFPSNDHPSDKATFTFHITVPRDHKVIANGDLQSVRTTGGSSTYAWNETSPMATYLATMDIGLWNIRTGRTPHGTRELVAVDPALAAAATSMRVFETSGEITDYWAQMLGPYPFTSTGAIVDDVPNVGFSLETQTRPLYGFAPDPGTMAHELAHQWFGDSVSVRTWREIWLNEGFATFAAALWDEHTGHGSTYTALSTEYRKLAAGDPFWKQSVADPTRDGMFSRAVYDRGAMTLAALRHRLGDAVFFRLLRTWTQQHRYGTATTAQFEALAQQVAHRDLRSFFRIWLVTQAKPASFDAG